MRPEHVLERRLVPAAGQALEPATELARAADQTDDGGRERQHDDDKAADDRPDVGRDERVDVDRSVLLAGGSSLPPADHRPPIEGPLLSFRRHGEANPIPEPNEGAARRQARDARARPMPRAATSSVGRAALDAPGALDAPSEPGDEMPVRSSSSLTETEFHRAEQLEAELVAKEREAIAESLRQQVARPGARGRQGGGPQRATVRARRPRVRLRRARREAHRARPRG